MTDCLQSAGGIVGERATFFYLFHRKRNDNKTDRYSQPLGKRWGQWAVAASSPDRALSPVQRRPTSPSFRCYTVHRRKRMARKAKEIFELFPFFDMCFDSRKREGPSVFGGN